MNLRSDRGVTQTQLDVFYLQHENQLLKQQNAWLMQQLCVQQQMLRGAAQNIMPPMQAPAVTHPIPPSTKPRPLAPEDVPQQLWDKALDEAPPPKGALKWRLSRKEQPSLVHDPRMGSAMYSARFVLTVPGLQVRKAKERLRGLTGERVGTTQWRYGRLLEEGEAPGVWMVKFEDADCAEKLDCGRTNRYEANPMPPVTLGLLEEEVRGGFKFVTCRLGLAGDKRLVELNVHDDTRVIDVRECFEQQAGEPNGLRLLHKNKNDVSRVLNDYEDSWNWQQSVDLDVADSNEALVLELFSVDKDSTQTLFWHSSMPSPSVSQTVQTTALGLT